MAASILGTDIQTGKPVALEQDTRLRGMYVIGKSGSGKTTFLVNLVLQDIEQGLGVCFLDPHGDAIADILARLPVAREKDVILLDPFDKTHAFGLNLYQCDNPFDIESFSYTVDYVLQVFAKLFAEGDLSQMPTMAQVLRTTAITLIENPGMTMAEIPLLLNHEDARARLTSQLKNRQALNFWKTYDRWRSEKQDEKTSSTLNKIDEFLSLPVIQQIVGQSLSTIDFRDIMDSGKILLVKLPARLEQVSNLIGSIIIGQLLNAAYSRSDIPASQRKQFCIFADEYQRFATPDFATLLVEARKFGIATTIAHQFRNQLDAENKGATLNAATLVIFAVSGIDAEEVAGQFDRTPQPAWEEEIEKEWVEVLAEEWEEEIEKEWHERVEEVVEDGVEEIKTPISNPFDWLVAHSHKDLVVSRFVDGRLKLLHELFMTETPFQYEFYLFGSTILDWKKQRNEQKDTVRDIKTRFQANLNSLFYRAMTNADPLSVCSENLGILLRLYLVNSAPFSLLQAIYSNPPKLRIVDVEYGREYQASSSYMNRGIGGFDYRHYTIQLPSLTQEQLHEYETLTVEETMANAIAAMIRARDVNQFQQASARFVSLAEQKLRNLIATHLSAYKEAYDKHIPSMKNSLNEKEKKGLLDETKLAGHERYFYTEEINKVLSPEQEAKRCEQEFQSWMKELQAFVTFIREFRDFVLALAKEPITSSSGLTQPRKRTQVHYLTHPRKTITHPRQTITHPRKTILHPQRTYADMQSEIANKLRGLPQYTAWVKLKSGEEHTIEIEDTEHFIRRADTPITVRDRLQTILSQTHLHYCKPRIEVVQEIAARQDELTRPIQRKQTVQTEERETVSSGTSSLTLDQRKKLSTLRKALGDEEYYRFYNDPLVHHQDTLKRLLDSPELTAEFIKRSFDDWREAGSPADISPFAELIKKLLG